MIHIKTNERIIYYNYQQNLNTVTGYPVIIFFILNKTFFVLRIKRIYDLKPFVSKVARINF